MIKLYINEKEVVCHEGTTILQAAESAGIIIPKICYHEKLTPPGLCRQCVVEVEGARVLLPSCITGVREGMKVQTDSPRVKRVRKTILEMLDNCTDLSEAPELQIQMKKYGVENGRFRDTVKRDYPVKDDNPFYIRDYSKCIVCGRCVQVCSEDIQFSYALTTGGRGFENRITTNFDKPLPETSCVFCGNCIEVCPSGALVSRREYSATGEAND
ncbi:MAG: (2Fe-2S)-binding protein [Spirochaetaceae bacterium]|nr:(2Fe-2S)-binding protein [Spirochaetaceae bacterium]